MKPKYYIILLISFACTRLFSQATTILSEGFEGGTLPSGWSQQMITGNRYGNIVNWTFTKGGYSYNPDSAAIGNKNARFFYNSENFETTRLITKKLNLLGKVKPVLEFYHVQIYWDWGVPAWDRLKVYYKNNQDALWHLLRDYSQNIEEWTKQSILLPDSILTDNFYIAFEGINAAGTSVCIDDIKIYETDVAARNVMNITAAQPYLNFVAAGTNDNPIFRTSIYVGGNDGTITLNSISVTSLNTSDNDIAVNGVKLYSTTDTLWQNPVLVGSATNFVSGKATFSGLNIPLNSNYNTYWICYNLESSAVPGHNLDCFIQAGDITINSATYPPLALNPNGQRKISDVIFYDDFETDKGWNLNLDFERNTPLGYGGYKGGESTFGPPDPSSAFSGSNVLGNDLSGIGTGNDQGNYYSNLSSYVYAETPIINCLNYKNTRLTFKRKLGVHYSHSAIIEISTNGGISWTRYWKNSDEGGSVLDNEWQDVEYNLSSIIDRKENIKIRFGIGETSSNSIGCGWNIDNFTLTGELVLNDIGVIAWNTPTTGCNKNNSEPVNVTVRNFTGLPSSNAIPIKYTLNGTTYFTDTIKTSIPAYSNQNFSFTQKVDLSNPGVYLNASASTFLAEDEDNRNNLVKSEVYSLGIKQLPYFENFENDSIWLVAGTEKIWQYGKPSKPVKIKTAASGTKAFSTYRTSFYKENDSSFIESPCFNFATAIKPVFEFKFMSELEEMRDGVVLQYKKDDISEWKIVPNHIYSWKGNWYTNEVNALGSKGWDTTVSQWTTAHQVLPDDIAGQSSVKFRFMFKTDSANNFEGFAFDDVTIFEAPIDIAIVSVDSTANACVGVNTNKPWFTLKNAGIRPILPSESFLVSYKINNGSPVTETFHVSSPLAVNSSIPLQFATPTNALDTAGIFNIRIIGHDSIPDFYESNNDTALTTITTYALPFSNLSDTFSSARLDTTYIRPHTDASYLYNWPDASDSSVWNQPTPGTYWVEIKIDDPNGCQIRDSFELIQLVRNYAVSSIVSPISNCALNPNATVSFSFKNLGNDTLNFADIPNIQAHYKYNNEASTNETFAFTEKLNPNDSIVFSFTTPITTLTSGDSVSVYFEPITLDADNANDTLETKLTAFGFPSVNIGNDTLVYGLYYELNAGAGYKTYKWNDSTELQTYKATFAGKHWVRVTDNHDCPASDTAEITLLRHDLSVTNIVNPKSNCSLSANEKIKITVHNDGTDTIASGTTVNLGYKLNNAVTVTSSLILSDIFLPNDTLNFEFSQFENLSAIGEYRLIAYAKIQDDMIVNNDTITDTIRVYGYPTLNLGSDITIKALQYSIDAGGGANRTFLWQDGSTTTQQFIVTESGVYSVKVTNSNTTCESFDTLQVNLTIDDGGITKLISPENNKSCTETFKEMAVAFTNIGTSTIPSAQAIILGYKTRNLTIRDTITLTSSLAPGDSIIHTFNGLEYIFVPGNNDFSIFSDLVDDMRTGNDTLFTSINVYNTPVVGLGGTIVSYSPVNLDAGGGIGYTYLWNDSSTLQTKYIDSTGFSPQKNFVRVTEPNGCTKSDTSLVTVYYPDVKVDSLKYPLSSCSNNITSAILVCKNLGNNTLKTGDVVDISLHSYNNGILFNEIDKNFVMKKDVANGDTFTFVFNYISQSVSSGNNDLKFVCSNLNDINTNDTLTYSLTVYYPPNFEIGSDNDTITETPPFTLTVGLGNECNYLWQDGSTAETFTADTSQWCKVKATNKISLCSSSDSVYIDMEIYDLKATNIAFDSSKCLDDLDAFNLEITNLGNRTVASSEIIQVTYLLNGTKTSTFNTNFPLGLAPNESTFVACTGLKSHFNAGTNNLKAYITFGKDQKDTNDTVTNSFTVNANPVLTLSDVNDTLELMSPYTLIAGDNVDLDYTWNHGETSRSINLIVSGKYIVTANDPATGCISKDSIIALLEVYDGITTSISNDPLCSGFNNSIEISYKNTGKYIYPIGTDIEMGYIYNNNQNAKKVVKLTEALNPNDVISSTFTNLSSYNIVGTNTIKTFSSTALDTVNINDTSVLVLELSPLPIVNIAGGDTIDLLSPYIITAESPDNVYYLWNTGEETSSIQVPSSDVYYVKVTSKDNVSCYASDTVHVNVLFKDGSLTNVAFENPLCMNSIDSIAVTYKNTGLVDFLIGDTLNIHYRFNNASEIITQEVLSADLKKNESVLITKSIDKTGLVLGSNNVLVFVKTTNDQNILNDTIHETAFVNEPPTVNIEGGDTIDLLNPYIISAESLDNVDYLWNTGEETSSIEALTSGTYLVKVTSTDNGCYGVDSIYVNTLSIDGSLTKVEFESPLCMNSINTFTITYKNTGLEDFVAGETIDIHYRFNNASEIITQEILTTDLKKNESVIITKNIDKTGLVVGSNNALVFAKIPNDKNSVNDTIHTTANINEPPTVNINGGDTIDLLSPYIISAESPDNVDYLWNTGEETSSIEALTSGTYLVKVTSTDNGCYGVDSIYVNTLSIDGSLTKVEFESPLCMNSINTFTITYKNTGLEDFAAGETIDIHYRFNDASEIITQEILSADLKKNESVIIAKNIDKTGLVVGSNNVLVFAKIANDKNSVNDTIHTIAIINAPPTVNIDGGDTIELLSPYIISAESPDNVDYLWNTGEETSSIEALTSGTYLVKATSTDNGCYATDSVYVNANVQFIDGSLTKVEFENPLCMNSINTFTITYKNTGLEDFVAGETIDIHYRFNDANEIITNEILSADLEKNESVTITKDIDKTGLVVGSNNVLVFAKIANDKNSINDTIHTIAFINAPPTVNIAGGDTIELLSPYIISAESPDNVSYLWNNGKTSSSIEAPITNTYIVKATSLDNGCYATDTVYVITKLFFDGSISNAEFNNPNCFNSINSISITYKNTGTANLVKGETLEIHYRFNNASEKILQEILTSDLEKDESVVIVKSINKTGLIIGSNNLLVFIKTEKDKNIENDTLRTSTVVYAAPTVTLANGNDLITFASTYLLDAGAGFSSYLWNTEATTQSIIVNTSGWIGVTVTNEFGCYGSDSVLMKKFTSIEGMETNQNLSVYPVPAKTFFNIEVTQTNLTDVVLEIYTSEMKLIVKKHYQTINDSFNQYINSSDWKKGMYYVCIRDKSGKILLSNKFLIQ